MKLNVGDRVRFRICTRVHEGRRVFVLKRSDIRKKRA